MPPKLPTGLSRDNKGFRFRRVDGIRVRLGTNRKAAIDAANHYNQLYRLDPDLLQRLTPKAYSTLGEYIEFYIPNHLEPLNLTKLTLEGKLQRIEKLKKVAGDTPIEYLADAAEVTKILDLVGTTPGVFNKYKSILTHICSHMVDEGILSENGPAKKKKRQEAPVKRMRLDVDGFNAIYACAPQWLKNAMDLALQTTQSRAEIAVMKFSDIENGLLHVIRRKVEKTEAAFVQYPVEGELKNIVERCRNSGLDSPFLIHRKPLKRYKSAMNTREHYTQLAVKQISDAFADARDESGHYDFVKDDPTKEPPTFHEIRALAINLYEGMGVNATPRASHNKRETTKLYLKRHGHVEFVKLPFAEIKLCQISKNKDEKKTNERVTPKD